MYVRFECQFCVSGCMTWLGAGMLLRFLFFIFCPMYDLTGRGARVRETTTRARGSRRCAPVSPSLLRFSLALSFLISLPLYVRATVAAYCWGFSCPERFRRAHPPAYAPEKELHALCRSSPFTFPLGAVTNEKPRLAACNAIVG